MRSGYVYLLGNEAMRGLYKIGSTERSPFFRAQQLSQNSSMPWPFHVIAFVEVEDRFDSEWRFHRELSDFRVNERREFFAFQRAALPWLVSLFTTFPGADTFWVDQDKWDLAELQAGDPWAWDDAAELYLPRLTEHAPIHITEAAELG